MPYVDPQTIDNPTAGQPIPAAWADQVRANLEFLVDPPVCSVYGSAAQSIADDTNVVMLANSENFDNDSMHSTSTNTGRITATTAGRYLFNGTVNFAANSTGRRLIYLRVNGTTQTLLYSSAAPTSPTTAVGAFTKTYVLAATDYVEVLANQNSGGALNTTLVEFAAVYLTR